MAGRIPQSFIDDLTARADIVELIGSRVELKKAGREYRACCPFHNEKTPSFWVSPVKQFYHCFGCGAHGTALGFLMEYDKLRFPEAIEELAGRLGLDVPREAGSQPDTAGSTAPLYDMNLRVAKYFASVLPNDRACARVRQETRPDARDRRQIHDRLRHQLLERSAEALRRERRTIARCSPTAASSSSASAPTAARWTATTIASATGSCSRSAIRAGAYWPSAGASSMRVNPST